MQGLAALAAVPFVTSVVGCDPDNREDQKQGERGGNRGPEPSGIRTLRIVLMGPFAVVLQKDKNYRVKAYIPFDPMHEFRFPSPIKVQTQHKFYQFRLQEESLEPSRRPLYRPWI